MASGNNASLVTAGKPKAGGAIFRAPLGTTLPTTADATLAEAFENLGFVSEDGVTNANTMESDEEKEWGGATVNTLQTSRTDNFQMKLMESMNVAVLKTVYGDTNVSGTLDTGITINVGAKELEDHVYVIDMILKDNALKRIVIPIGRISETEEIKYVSTESVGYGITITAQADANDNTHYEYIKAS